MGLWDWLTGNDNVQAATDKMTGSMTDAVNTINQATTKASALNQPYMNPEVFKHLSDLVSSGYFQKPMPQGWQAQSFNSPQFNFSPGQGKFNMTPWQPQGPPPSITPMSLPPGYAMPSGGAPQGPTTPPQGPQALQGPTLQDLLKMMLKGHSISLPQTPTLPVGPNPGYNPTTGQNGPNYNPATGQPGPNVPPVPIGSGPMVPGGFPRPGGFPMPSPGGGFPMPGMGMSPFMLPNMGGAWQ